MLLDITLARTLRYLGCFSENSSSWYQKKSSFKYTKIESTVTLAAYRQKAHERKTVLSSLRCPFADTTVSARRPWLLNTDAGGRRGGRGMQPGWERRGLSPSLRSQAPPPRCGRSSLRAAARRRGRGAAGPVLCPAGRPPRRPWRGLAAAAPSAPLRRDSAARPPPHRPRGRASSPRGPQGVRASLGKACDSCFPCIVLLWRFAWVWGLSFRMCHHCLARCWKLGESSHAPQLPSHPQKSQNPKKQQSSSQPFSVLDRFPHKNKSYCPGLDFHKNKILSVLRNKARCAR